LEIAFTSTAVASLCNDGGLAKRKLGAPCARKLRARLDDLDAAANLAVMAGLPGKCHELKGDRLGQLAIELHGGIRLVLVPNHDPIPRKADGGLDWAAVTAVTIIEVVDYHD
jgi:proteic killer suppression protein